MVREPVVVPSPPRALVADNTKEETPLPAKSSLPSLTLMTPLCVDPTPLNVVVPLPILLIVVIPAKAAEMLCVPVVDNTKAPLAAERSTTPAPTIFPVNVTSKPLPSKTDVVDAFDVIFAPHVDAAVAFNVPPFKITRSPAPAAPMPPEPISAVPLLDIVSVMLPPAFPPPSPLLSS